MTSIINIRALFLKQLKDVLKNKQVLILYFVYPLIAFIMTQSIGKQSGSSLFFISIFATMHCVFTPLVSTASFISEEKEKNTLRVLIMSNISFREFLISIGSFVLILTLITGTSFLFMDSELLKNAALFLCSLAVSCCTSIILGVAIGLHSKSMSAANGFAVPLGMFFSFLPMLSYFNSDIELFSKFTFGQQISYLLSNTKEPTFFGCTVIFANLLLFMFLAQFLYSKGQNAE